MSGPVSKTIKTQDLSLEVTGLAPGALYEVKVVATLLQQSLEDPSSVAAVMTTITAPLAPPAPTVGNVGNNRASLEVDLAAVLVPNGASMDYLSVMYYKVDGESGSRIAGTQSFFIQRLMVSYTFHRE